MALPFQYNDFHGGLNTLGAPFLLTDNEARDLQNVQGTTAGAIVKRNGLSTFATPAQALTSLFALESVSPVQLVGAGSTNLYSISTGGALATIKTGVTTGLNWSFVSAPVVSAQGPMFGMNGTDTPQQWSGTGLTANWTATDAGGTVPNGKYCIYSQNQVFVSGTTSNPSRVYWSGIADPTAWNPANLNGSGFMDFDPNDGGAITAIGTIGPYILVAKPRKLWVITSVPTASARKISDNVGVASHRSLATGPEGLYFLSEDRGVYITNGSKLTPISDKIQPTIDSIQAGLRSQAAGGYFNQHYYLSVPVGGSTNNTLLDYDAKLQSWWKHTIGSNQFVTWHPTVGQVGLYSAKSTAAFVDQCFAANTFQDNGANFTWVWRGPWQSPTFYRRRRFPTPYFRKRLRQVRCDGYGTIDFSIAKDFAAAETLWQPNVFNYALAGADTFAGSGLYGASDGRVFGGAATATRARLYSLGVANAFSLVFSATSNSADALFEYTMMVTDRKDSVT